VVLTAARAPRGRADAMNSAATTRRRAFTLLELLVVITIIGILAGLLVPAALEVLHIAHQAACASNLRQLGVAVSMYVKDNGGCFFAIRSPNDPKTPEDEGKLWYFGYETGTSWSGTAEGSRVLDKSRAKLYPYTDDYEGIEICPGFDYFGSFKAKFRGKWWTYGINKALAPDLYADRGERYHSLTEIRASDASRTIVMADAAQVNTFQPPASPARPLIEEWHYVQPATTRFRDYPHIHFRHRGQANVLFADWHVEAVEPAPGTLDTRLPAAMIGGVDEERFLYLPYGSR